MYCSKCGKEIRVGANFCGACGNRVVVIKKKEEETVVIEDKPKTTAPETMVYEPTGPDYKEGDMVYARCVNVGTVAYRFLCIDNVTQFYWSANAEKQKGCGIKEGTYVWAKLFTADSKDKHTFSVRMLNKAESSIGAEMAAFYKAHKVGDTLYAPVTRVEKDYCELGIGPNATVRVLYRKLPKEFDVNTIKVGTIEKITITSLVKESAKRIIAEVEIREQIDWKNGMFSTDKELWCKLPNTLLGTAVDFPEDILEYIRADYSVSSQLFGEKEINCANLRSILDKKYQEVRQEKLLSIRGDSGCMFFEFDLGIRDEHGVPQCACFKKQKGKSWVLCLLGFASAERYLSLYVYVEDWKSVLDELAGLACKGEEWDWPSSKAPNKYILKRNLLHTFYKVWLDGQIVEENGEALFNTGHVDGAYDDIYCYLRKNTHEDFYNRKWEIGFFACRAKGEKGKKLNGMFKSFPKAPSYRDIGRSEDREYDPQKELFCDYDHIISDNLDRLPAGFLRNRLCYDMELNDLLEACMEGNKTAFSKAKRIIKADDYRGEHLRRDIQNGLEDAVKTMQKYARWNSQVAIPMYYPRTNRISLMLPLKLRGGSSEPFDVALVVERLANGNYQGQTILTPEMAYQDARQIRRPYSEWLSTSNLRRSNNNEAA